MIPGLPKHKEILPMFFILVLVFYHIYPQALEVRGSSFIFLSGIMGLALYAYHGFPFKEVFKVIIGLAIFFFLAYASGWLNDTEDKYTFGYPKSEIAWLFSAYLIVFMIFRVHKRPSYNTLLLYIVSAIALQSVIAFAMNRNDAIHDFFYSIQMQAEYTEEIMEEGGSQRLMGYGIGFFGAGAIAGIGLLIISYLLMRMKMNNWGFVVLSLSYVLIFYIGLFMARTTVTGMAVGFILIAVLYLWDRRSEKKQVKAFVIAAVFLMAAGYSFVMAYFPHFSDWAFELFTNFLETGELTTNSSSGLDDMFIFPKDLDTLLFGAGQMEFAGTDVGYSRTIFWVGIPGALYFYLYQMYLAKLSFTKDWGINSLAVAMVFYSYVLNIKGWIDLNLILFLFFFYFMFYKYYVFLPKKESKKISVSSFRKQYLEKQYNQEKRSK